MAKITAVTNGLQGLLARQQINEAIETVEVDSTITGDGNLGSPLSAATALATKATKVDTAIVVKTASDFPTPSAGVITLADNTSYLIDGVVAISDTITPGTNSSIISLEHTANELNYTGVGSMFKGSNKSFHVDTVSLRCATGTLNDWVDLAPLKDSVIEYSTVIFKEVKNLGLSTDIKQLRYFACVFEDIKTTGHTFAGDIGQIFSVDTDYVNNSVTPLYDLGTATTDLMWHLDYQVDLNNVSGSFISGLTNSGNINVGGLGQALIGLFKGPGTPLIGIDNGDIRWNFRDNNRIPDTNPDALLSLTGNATETVIAAIDTPALVAGTWVVERTSLFTGTPAGRATYNGERNLVVPVTIQATIEASIGNNKDITMYVALNGSIIAAASSSNKVSAGDPRVVNVPWQLDLAEDDFIEIFIENNTDDINLVVTSAVIRVR